MAAKPFSTPISAYQSALSRLFLRYAVPIESRYIALQGPDLRVHVLEAGAGEPLLLIHGGGGSAADWVPLAALLHNQFRLYMVDLPGHGLSDPLDYRRVPIREYATDFLGAVMDALELDRAALAANSVGAFWTMAFALRRPDRVNRVALLGAPLGSEQYVPLAFRLLSAPVINRAVAFAARHATLARTRNLFGQVVANIDRVPPEYLAAARLATRLPGRMRSAAFLGQRLGNWRMPTPARALYQELQQSDVPFLFVLGDRDVFSPAPAVCRLARHGRIEILPDAGHLPWFDQPDRCAQLLRDFLATGGVRT